MRRMLGIAAVGMLLLAACGGGGGGSNNATCAPNGAQLDITAKSGAYDKACLAAPANQPFTITFHNDEAGAPHNVDILTSANGSSPTCQGSPQCLLQRHVHRVELMVSGHLLGEHSTAHVLEYDEVTDQIEESFRQLRQPEYEELIQMAKSALDLEPFIADSPSGRP